MPEPKRVRLVEDDPHTQADYRGYIAAAHPEVSLDTADTVGMTYWRQVLLCLLLVGLPVISTASSFRGQVLNSDTHKPVAGLKLKLALIGAWNIFANYEYSDITDNDGHFSFTSYHNDTGLLRVLPGQHYAAIQININATKPLTVMVKPLTTQSLLEMSNAWIGIMDGHPFGWSFTHRTPVFDPNEADIFPILVDKASQTRHILLKASPRGGIAYVDASSYGLQDFVGYTILFYLDTVPEVAFKSEATCDLSHNNGWIFIKTEAGNYAKAACDSTSFVTSISPHNADWAIGLNSVYNPSGSRNVAYTGILGSVTIPSFLKR